MSYKADLSPAEAHALLTEREDAVLIDCRTQAECCLLYTSPSPRDRG